MKNFIAVCICVFTLVACGTDETPKNAREAVQDSPKGPAASLTEPQVFAYILGEQFGLPSYLNMPSRIGAMLDLDAIVQGIVDNESVLKDSARELQVSPEVQKQIEAHYAKQVEEREKAGENARPVALAGPIKGGNVIIRDTTAPIVKYSYMQGVQMDLLFNGMRRNFGEDFDAHYFIMGIRESVFSVMDSTFQKSVSDSLLQAVSIHYKNRMKQIREERRNAVQ